MELKKIRKRIDRIDHELLGLLTERMELALRSRKFKEEIRDEARETSVLDRALRYSRASDALPEEFAEKLYSSILDESRKLQVAGSRLIGFQGEHGAYSEAAARLYDPSLITIPCQEFEDVFENVESGALDLGIIPVENSLAGQVVQVTPLLVKTPLKIAGGLKFQVNHCLMKLPETDHRDIRKVYSHPQALSQCRNFLSRHQLEGIPYFDTAGAARMLAVERPPMAGVIAGANCADIYGLEVLKQNVQDARANVTRFILLSREEKTEGANTCSIIFSLPHKAGALYNILRIFAEKGLNLTRIESFPNRDGLGSFSFFLDFQSENVLEISPGILETLKEHTVMLKPLGCYREAGPA
ncbi:MAG: bifunctional chorismate mutase/prephenate dehydratase [Candidatus Aminicenantales bacterium]